MDCLCCSDCCSGGGVGPPSDTEFLGSICSLKDNTGAFVKFPAEPGRYTMYVIAGCPFAARPWIVMGFYGLADPSIIPTIKLFPASFEDGWFFEPKSEGERSLVRAFPTAQVDKDPHHGAHHLSELYYHAKKDFKGAISVPLLWDSKEDTAVSNSSMGLAEMIATQMRSMATRHKDIMLFPCCSGEPELYKEHDELCKMLHRRITTAVYTMNSTKDGAEHDKLVDNYYATLDELEEKLQNQPYLMGDHIRFADLLLFISLVRLDLAYQWRFGLGRKNVRENYPALAKYQKTIMSIPGIVETILPRDIMALYFMTLKWTNAGAGRTLPQVPEAWQQCFACSGQAFEA